VRINQELQGGIVIANGNVINYLPLPFAGILSTESAYIVDKKLKELHSMVKKMDANLTHLSSKCHFFPCLSFHPSK